MAHARQELALGVVGALGFVARSGQLRGALFDAALEVDVQRLEVVLGNVAPLQRGAEGLRRACHRAEFVAALARRPRHRRVARAQTLQRAHQRGHVGGEAARQQHAHQRDQQQRDRQRHEKTPACLVQAPAQLVARTRDAVLYLGHQAEKLRIGGVVGLVRIQRHARDLLQPHRRQQHRLTHLIAVVDQALLQPVSDGRGLRVVGQAALHRRCELFECVIDGQDAFPARLVELALGGLAAKRGGQQIDELHVVGREPREQPRELAQARHRLCGDALLQRGRFALLHHVQAAQDRHQHRGDRRQQQELGEDRQVGQCSSHLAASVFQRLAPDFGGAFRSNSAQRVGSMVAR